MLFLISVSMQYTESTRDLYFAHLLGKITAARKNEQGKKLIKHLGPISWSVVPVVVVVGPADFLKLLLIALILYYYNMT